MLMTEKEASTKGCPKALAPDTYSETIAVNRERKSTHPNCLCIASNCMAWRSVGKQRETIRNYHDAQTVTRIKGALDFHTYEGGWQYEHTDIDRDGRRFDVLHRIASDDAPDLGYCGAFGKPEA